MSTHDDDKTALAMAGNAAGAFIAALAGQGLPLHLILIALHAEVVLQAAAAFGGQAAAGMCDRASARLRDMPSAADWAGADRATHTGGQA